MNTGFIAEQLYWTAIVLALINEQLNVIWGFISENVNFIVQQLV